MPPSPPLNPNAPGQPPTTLLGRLDAWMAANPWHPRATPFFVYMIGILLGGLVTDGPFGLPKFPAVMPLVYIVQVGLVVFLLVRYRKLVPELNIKFHWLAVPTGIGLLFAWVHLGYATNWAAHQLHTVPTIGEYVQAIVPVDVNDPWNRSARNTMNDNRGVLGEPWFWTAMILRLVGMSVVVPLFEEMWVRSAVLRGCFSPAKTKLAIIQLAQDLPIIGDSIAQTDAAKRAAQQPPLFTQQLVATAVGRITFFSVVVSTLVFMLAHQRRDYLGCIACGVVWCGLVWYTNKPKKGETWDDQPPGGRMGIGPIVWSHGITNAALWAWTLYTDDWQFL